jgi:hypothetical protein
MRWLSEGVRAGHDAERPVNQPRRDPFKLFVLALVVRLVVAGLVTRPGYMDPSYYTATAVNLVQGEDLNEPFIWNYLDDPVEVSHPGFLYWMPLPSFVAMPFAALFPGSFFALQVPFAFLSALLPLVAYGIARQVTDKRWLAWSAGLMVLFSGYFFPYWTLPETFAPYALFGSLALWLAGCGRQNAGLKNVQRWLTGLMVGLLVGLAHLTRADGILLLPVVVAVPLFFSRSHSANHVPRITQYVPRFTLYHCLPIVLGYLLVMAPWIARNLVAAGSPLSPGGTKTLWLTNYDDLFCYGCDLTLQSYLAWGWDNILSSKLWALSVNAQRFLAENCLVFAFPFAGVGFYRLRRRIPFANALIYLVIIYVAHSVAFTYPGARGGFFHASSAVLPFLFVAAMEGLGAAVRWVGKRRRWDVRQATTVFTVAAVVAAAGLGIHVAGQLLPRWQRVDRVYEEIGQWMVEQGIDGDAVVMVNNPPAFWYYTHHPSVVVPAGDVDALLAAADRYGVEYVVLDSNRPLGVQRVSHPRLRESANWGEPAPQTVVYQLVGK